MLLIQNRDPRRFGLAGVRPVEDQRRVGHFEEQLGADDARPLALEQVVRIGVLGQVGRFRRDQRAAAQADVRVLEVPGRR